MTEKTSTFKPIDKQSQSVTHDLYQQTTPRAAWESSFDGNVTETEKEIVREVVGQVPKPFDFKNIKIVLKKHKKEEEETILLDRNWAW